MNGKTGGNPGPRRAAPLAVPIAISMLVTACGAVHVHFGSSAGSAPAAPAVPRADLAYAQCMRAHGQQSFPIPGPSGSSSFGQLAGNPGSPAARAYDACSHLLPGGSSGTGGTTAP
jgi:hypothetical protein